LSSLKDSTTILNGSHLEIEQNRKAINELIFALDTWKGQWEIVNRTMSQLQRRDRGLRMIVYAEILNALLTEFMGQILKKEMQINSVLNHKIDPTVIEPTVLVDLLQNITRKLPLNVFLPYKNDDLIAVYKNLDVATVATTRGILILISIPLLNSRTEFQLYHVVNIAVFLRDTNITAKYQITTNYFAMSMDHSWVMYLTSNEFHRCNVPHQKYCAISSPLYHTSFYDNDCVINYFLKKQHSKIKCPMKFEETGMKMEARYLIAGHWIISVPHSVVLRIICRAKPKMSILIEPPLYILKLLPGCEAISHDFKLTTYYKGESDLQLNTDLWYYHKLDNFSFWNGLEDKIKLAKIHIPHQLGKLVMDATSFESLEKQIDENIAIASDENHRISNLDSHHKKPWYYWFSIVTITVLILIVSGVILWLYCTRKRIIDTVAQRVIYKRNPENVEAIERDNPALNMDIESEE
jgi:hypothetical protein